MRLGERRYALTIYAIIAVAGAMLEYSPTIHYGFYYDDYHFVRPYSRSEILAAFSGPWDPSGIEVALFRPLTILLFAVRFHYFGLNADAHHVVSIAMFVAAALLVGMLARQTMGTTAAGAVTMSFFLMHPAMPYAAVAWITNQMHLLEMIVVLTALVWWDYVRKRPISWWLPLLALQMMAVLVKEDGIMLGPAVLILHWLRRQLVEGDLQKIPRAFLAMLGIAVGAVLGYRAFVLHGWGGYHLPTAARAWSNIVWGLDSVLRQVPARRPWQREASWFVTALPLLGFASWRWLPQECRFAMLAGFAIAILFDLPFVFVVKAEQLHLVATGAALILGAAAIGLLRLTPGRPVRIVVLALLVAGAAALGAVTRNITRDFDPFGTIVLANDKLVEGWAAVPAELRRYLEQKPLAPDHARDAANPALVIPFVAFGLHGPEVDPEGITVRWMSAPETDLYVRADARDITIPLRHEIGAFREPARLRIAVDGRVLDRITFADGTWRVSHLALRPETVSLLTRMHRIRLLLDHAWIPATLIPGSADQRTLGLQLGTIRLK